MGAVRAPEGELGCGSLIDHWKKLSFVLNSLLC
jgi:hypothetical protein